MRKTLGIKKPRSNRSLQDSSKPALELNSRYGNFQSPAPKTPLPIQCDAFMLSMKKTSSGRFYGRDNDQNRFTQNDYNKLPTLLPIIYRITYFIDMFEEDVPAGLLGPLPESQATRLNTVITNNNNWLTYFIIFSFIIQIYYRLLL